MIGPSLPPHLHKPDTEETTEHVTTTPPSKQPVAGPQLPPHLTYSGADRKRKRDEESFDDVDKTTYGPTLPPKRQLEPRKPSPPSPAEDSDSDPEVGPSLSAMMTPAESVEHTRKQAIERLSHTSPQPNTTTSSEPKLQRDSWMLAPPTRADWLGTLDASKLKARTFNQSKSGTNSQTNPVDHTLWTETPLERAQRIEGEALGRRTKPATLQENEEKKVDASERDRRIKEYNAKTRGPSLMEKYAGTRKVDEDDPSKRGFDYQKDIAGGGTMGFKERSAMIGKAKNLDSKYSGGNYL
jgi:Protein of unknown function (DUF3752)